MKKSFTIFIAGVAWAAVALQYYLLIENRTTTIAEATVRFFSFFTILTNTLVAVYFTWRLVRRKRAAATVGHSCTLTAVTVYITIVGLVYQVLLRHLWQPTGLQFIVDELLHTIIPLAVILYWSFLKNPSRLQPNFLLAYLSACLSLLCSDPRKLLRLLSISLPKCISARPRQSGQKFFRPDAFIYSNFHSIYHHPEDT